MKNRMLLVCLALLLLAVPALAQEPVDIAVTGAWARATAMGGGHSMGGMQEATAEPGAELTYGPSAVYMMIENHGGQGVRLVAAATAAAAAVEIHETQMENDVMRMRMLENGLDIPAGESVSLEPGGYHMMLFDLPHDLLPGQAIALTLTFALLDDAGAVAGEPVLVDIGAPVLSEPPATGDVVALGAWARATAMRMDGMGSMDEATPEPGLTYGPSAVYLTLTNRGAAADRLVAVRTDAASIVEIHETQMENDVMRMRPLENGLEIPAGERVMLEPGGYHIMLLDLPRDLLPGEAIALTLVFESGVEMVIAAPVRELAAMPMNHGG